MSDLPRVLVVDDELLTHELVAQALRDSCTLSNVKTGEEALAVVQSELPDLILIDVFMPGMDGYEVCRRLKEIDELADVPIMFISGHDQIEDRLRGYEAGGADFVAKPFHLKELKAKVDYLLSLASQKNQIREMADFASKTAMTAMTSMSELGSLLESMKRFNSCEDFESVANCVIAGVVVFDLRSVVQIRTPQEKLTQTDHGPVTPLEESVIEHMTAMERITHFKSRMSIHYEHVTLLISNMPVNDEERCGRLRDHLAMLVEASEVRIRSILSIQQSSLRGAAIERTAAKISDALREIDANQRNSRLNARTYVERLVSNLSSALSSVALTEAEEAYLISIVSKGTDEIINAQTDEIELQNHLSDIVKELKGALSS